MVYLKTSSREHAEPHRWWTVKGGLSAVELVVEKRLSSVLSEMAGNWWIQAETECGVVK
jgi:hypothetical protein